MCLVVTERFRRAYRFPAPEDRKRVQKTLRFMAEDLRHPRLRVKRIQGTTGILEARAGPSIRLTFGVEGSDLVLRNVGQHDDALRRP